TQYCRITPDGKLTPCPYIPEEAGDLQTQGFAEIWRSAPLLRQLREGALGGKCGSCEYRQLCGGCRARALALEGDVLAADPSCVYEPGADAAAIEAVRDVTYGSDCQPALSWSPAARERVARIPSVVRAVVAEAIGIFGGEERYCRLSREFMRLLLVAYSATAIWGATLVFGLSTLYPRFWAYLTAIFAPSMWVYDVLLFVESFTLYLYY